MVEGAKQCTDVVVRATYFMFEIGAASALDGRSCCLYHQHHPYYQALNAQRFNSEADALAAFYAAERELLDADVDALFTDVSRRSRTWEQLDAEAGR